MRPVTVVLDPPVPLAGISRRRHENDT